MRNLCAIISIISVTSLGAYGQDYRQGRDLDQYHLPPVVHGHNLPPMHPMSSELPATGFDPFIQKMSKQITAQLEQKYQELLVDKTLPVKDCTASDLALRKVRTLRVQGDFQGCIDLARTCQSGVDSKAQLTLMEGAACANQSIQIKEAYKLLDRATSGVFVQAEFQDLAVYRFALFAETTQYGSEIPAILARHQKWNAQEIKEMMAILTLINHGHAESMPEDQIQQKIQSLLLKNSDWANEMTIAWVTHLVVNKYDRIGGLKFLDKNFHHVYELDRGYKYVFHAFYSTPAQNYKLVTPTLEVYYKHSTAFSWYPVEQNIYTVSEQYNSICRNTLSQSSTARELSAIKKLWLAGGRPEDILAKVVILNQKNPNKADILTLKASLLSTLSKEEEAFQDYWKAHELCAYYHRSHWGLSGIKKDRFYKSLNDYDDIRRQVAKEVAEGIFPPSISKYVMNWDMLLPAQQEGVKHAIKIWGPFIDGLVAAGTKLYIKHDFEFHSEIPGYETDRDERASAPDNRLLDELRGRGGNPVVSDLGETLRTAHGDYNLGAHEIAHSWHIDYLENAGRKDLYECIAKLFAASTKRGVFADPYAASNETEYFAQSVGYYLIPKSAPARYGLTSAWVEKYDPDMFEFVRMIESSKGDLRKIRCPI